VTHVSHWIPLQKRECFILLGGHWPYPGVRICRATCDKSGRIRFEIPVLCRRVRPTLVTSMVRFTDDVMRAGLEFADTRMTLAVAGNRRLAARYNL